MHDNGFKKLTERNWLGIDETLKNFVRLNLDGTFKTLTTSDWFKVVFDSKINKNVPEEIKILFEIAQSTMIYGYFYYPIFSLASEQFNRIAETAINQKCKELKTPQSIKGFKKKVLWLRNENFISEQKYISWMSTVEIRNFVSHPPFQRIVFPSMAIESMEAIAKNINELFSN